MAKKVYVGAPCLAANALGRLAEGSTVKIKENGALVDFYVAKHDYEPALNGRGRTLLLRKDCYDRGFWSTNDTNSYINSDIDVSLQNDYKISLSTKIQSAMGETVFYYTPGNGNDVVSTLARAVFTPSLTEFGLSTDNSSVEGEELPNAKMYQIAHLNGDACNQWTRSALRQSKDSVFQITALGTVEFAYVQNLYGVRPCFTLPAAIGVFNGEITGEMTTNGADVAHNVTGIYVGVNTDVPIYKEEIKTLSLTGDNISEFFEVKNDQYYFEWQADRNGFCSNSYAIHNSVAKTVLTAKCDLSDLDIDISGESEANYDVFSLFVDGVQFAGPYSGRVTNGGVNIAKISKGSEITLQYSKDGSGIGYSDSYRVQFTSVTGAVKTLVGYEKKDVARKVKRAYIGIGGVARPCFSIEKLAYFGAVTPLSSARQGLAATTIGNYALFGGGLTGSGKSGVVDAYDRRLTRTTPTELSVKRYHLAAATVGNYALFGGGYGSGAQATVDAYDKSLVRTTATDLRSNVEELAGTSVGGYAIFAGGYMSGYASTVSAYNASLTQAGPTGLLASRSRMGAATVGNYALFGGGYGGREYSTVDVYDANLTHMPTSVNTLQTARYFCAATTVGNYALFGGGTNGNPLVNVDAYGQDLTKIQVENLTWKRTEHTASTVGSYALFAGGIAGTNPKATDVYDTSLTHTTIENISLSKRGMAATTVGDFALFGGGSEDTYYDTVDAYTI